MGKATGPQADRAATRCARPVVDQVRFRRRAAMESLGLTLGAGGYFTEFRRQRSPAGRHFSSPGALRSGMVGLVMPTRQGGGSIQQKRAAKFRFTTAACVEIQAPSHGPIRLLHSSADWARSPSRPVRCQLKFFPGWRRRTAAVQAPNFPVVRSVSLSSVECPANRDLLGENISGASSGRQPHGGSIDSAAPAAPGLWWHDRQ